MNDKCFICGKNPKAPGKNICAECVKKYPPQPLQPAEPDWAEDGTAGPLSSVFDDDMLNED